MLHQRAIVFVCVGLLVGARAELVVEEADELLVEQMVAARACHPLGCDLARGKGDTAETLSTDAGHNEWPEAQADELGAEGSVDDTRSIDGTEAATAARLEATKAGSASAAESVHTMQGDVGRSVDDLDAVLGSDAVSSEHDATLMPAPLAPAEPQLLAVAREAEEAMVGKAQVEEKQQQRHPGEQPGQQPADATGEGGQQDEHASQQSAPDEELPHEGPRESGEAPPEDAEKEKQQQQRQSAGRLQAHAQLGAIDEQAAGEASAMGGPGAASSSHAEQREEAAAGEEVEAQAQAEGGPGGAPDAEEAETPKPGLPQAVRGARHDARTGAGMRAQPPSGQRRAEAEGQKPQEAAEAAAQPGWGAAHAAAAGEGARPAPARTPELRPSAKPPRAEPRPPRARPAAPAMSGGVRGAAAAKPAAQPRPRHARWLESARARAAGLLSSARRLAAALRLAPVPPPPAPAAPATMTAGARAAQRTAHDRRPAGPAGAEAHQRPNHGTALGQSAPAPRAGGRRGGAFRTAALAVARGVGMAGVFAAAHPLDSLKVRAQLASSSSASSRADWRSALVWPPADGLRALDW